jgi:hypothetical protein
MEHIDVLYPVFARIPIMMIVTFPELFFSPFVKFLQKPSRRAFGCTKEFDSLNFSFV